MIVTCGDIECKYYSPTGCTAPSVDHSTDRFCVTGRKIPKDEIEFLMRAKPLDFKRCGK